MDKIIIRKGATSRNVSVIRVDGDVYEKLIELTAEANRSITEVASILLREALKHVEVVGDGQ